MPFGDSEKTMALSWIYRLVSKTCREVAARLSAWIGGRKTFSEFFGLGKFDLM
jgi:hypothetical protein